jgi:hypothetical protein
MNNESDKYILFSSIIGILLTISEILPYIKTIKSNGVIQFFIETFILLLKKKPNGIMSIQQNNQTEQLLENFLETLHEINPVETNTNNLDKLDNQKNDILKDSINTTTLENTNIIVTSQASLQGTIITITLNSPNQIKTKLQ